MCFHFISELEALLIKVTGQNTQIRETGNYASHWVMETEVALRTSELCNVSRAGALACWGSLSDGAASIWRKEAPQISLFYLQPGHCVDIARLSGAHVARQGVCNLKQVKFTQGLRKSFFSH